jgi:hypothetical protein
VVRIGVGSQEMVDLRCKAANIHGPADLDGQRNIVPDKMWLASCEAHNTVPWAAALSCAAAVMVAVRDVTYPLSGLASFAQHLGMREHLREQARRYTCTVVDGCSAAA